MTLEPSVFAKYVRKNLPYVWEGTLHIGEIHGGTPGDPKTIEGWLKKHLGASTGDVLRAQVAEVMADRGMEADEAAAVVANETRVNGFKKDDQGLYLEGRCLKACLKEAASVANNEDRLGRKFWGGEAAGKGKGITGWLPEHIFVVEERLHLGVVEADGVSQRFMAGTFLSGGKASIKYEEFVQDVKLSFTVETDHKFTTEQWAAIWVTAERMGVGSSRSQGFGRFSVVRWEQVQ